MSGYLFVCKLLFFFIICFGVLYLSLIIYVYFDIYD